MLEKIDVDEERSRHSETQAEQIEMEAEHMPASAPGEPQEETGASGGGEPEVSLDEAGHDAADEPGSVVRGTAPNAGLSPDTGKGDAVGLVATTDPIGEEAPVEDPGPLSQHALQVELDDVTEAASSGAGAIFGSRSVVADLTQPVETSGCVLPATVRDLHPALADLPAPGAVAQLVLAIAAALAAPQDRVSVRLAGSASTAALQIVGFGPGGSFEAAVLDLIEAIDDGRTAGFSNAQLSLSEQQARYGEAMRRIEAARLLGLEPREPEPHPPIPPREPRPAGCLADKDFRVRLEAAHRHAGLLVVHPMSAPALALPRRAGNKKLSCDAIESSARCGIAYGRRVRLGSIGAAAADQLLHWAASERALRGLIFLPATDLEAAVPALAAAVRRVAAIQGPLDFVLDPPTEGSEGAAARRAIEQSAAHAKGRAEKVRDAVVRIGQRVLAAEPGSAHLSFAASAPRLTALMAVGLHALLAGLDEVDPAPTVPSTTMRAAGVLARHVVDYGLRVLAPAAMPRVMRDARLVYNCLGETLRGEVALSTITRTMAEDLDAGRIGEALALLEGIGLVESLEGQEDGAGKQRSPGRPPTRFRRLG